MTGFERGKNEKLGFEQNVSDSAIQAAACKGFGLIADALFSVRKNGLF